MSEHFNKSGGYRALRQGRISIPKARYFLTIVTKERQAGLACDHILIALRSICDALPADTLAFVIMPDHIHWLIALDDTLELSEVVRLLKGRLSPALRKANLSWQSGAYHDRRLRLDDELAPFLRYMLCNPYRKNLCRNKENWRYWYCRSDVRQWFETTTIEGRPQPEWINDERLPPWTE